MSDFLSAFDDASAQLSRDIAQSVESNLVEYIEAVEGHVPANDEIAKFGTRIPRDGGQVDYLWRGVVVASVIPPRKMGFPWQVTGLRPPT